MYSDANISKWPVVCSSSELNGKTVESGFAWLKGHDRSKPKCICEALMAESNLQFVFKSYPSLTDVA